MWYKDSVTNFHNYTAPSEPPVLRVTSATPTTISIAWSEIPCLMRNGMIFRYIVSFCHVSVTNCEPLTNVSNGAFTFNKLIPRSSYNIAIRADSLSVTEIPYIGPLSPPITADTAAPQGLQLWLPHNKCYHSVILRSRFLPEWYNLST